MSPIIQIQLIYLKNYIKLIAIRHILGFVALTLVRIEDKSRWTVLVVIVKLYLKWNKDKLLISYLNPPLIQLWNYHKNRIVVDAEVVAAARQRIGEIAVGTWTDERFRFTTWNI